MQCTQAQVVKYLDDRVSKGFNAILFQPFEHLFSSQSPAYTNANGDNPFTTMTDLSTPNEAYWSYSVDFVFRETRRRGMLCIFTFIYHGNDGTEEGWDTELVADTQAHRQTYGSFLMKRYGGMGHILWTAGGDSSSDTTAYADVITGMRQVRTDFNLTAHVSPFNDGYSAYSAQTGFNVNTIYTNGTEYDYAATAYARSGPIPFFHIEGYYDNEHSSTPLRDRRQAYAAILSGACGHVFGNNPIWLFGGANNTFADGGSVNNIGAAAALTSTWLSTTGTTHMRYVRPFFESFAWEKLVPKTGTSLVTTNLGAVENTICPAAASDGSFAMVLTPNNAGFTIDNTVLSHSYRARWFDPSNGTYTLDTASIANTGTHAFTTPGTNSAGSTDWIWVAD